MGARTRPAVLRRVGPLPRLPHRIRAAPTRPSRRRRGSHRALSRRPRRQLRAGRVARLWARGRQRSEWRARARSAGGGGLPVMRAVPVRLRQSVNPARVGTLMRFGFSERQARFLVHVLVFSGVFLERQYRAFTGLAHGQKTHDFLTKLVTAGYATPITPGALHRGRLYHVQYKPLYEAIGEANNRHRRPASLGWF